ncbi:MAG: HIT domain-containing protein [Candidatus Omnitrophota bacterium]|jgi:ATP adenylyltransferase
MNKLWAPWRISYIRGKKEKGCIFCRALKSKTRDHVVIENKYSFAMLNLYPYNNGHLMVAPKRHTADLSGLKDNELLDIFKTLKSAKAALNKLLKPHGYNIGINLSRDAGAGVTGHLHIHIVPRFRGDTNFMPALFNTKVISQSLDELYRCLRKKT